MSETSIPETLISKLRAGKVIPFVGAGVSLSVVQHPTNNPLFPNWETLLRRSSERLRAENKSGLANLISSLIDMGTPEDYLVAAQRARDGLGAVWYDFLRDQLDHPRESVDDESLELARLVWALRCRIIVTTNYDRVLHWACPERDDLAIWDTAAPAEQVKLLRGEIDRPVIWHLHGHIDNLAGIILTPDGYNRLYLHDVKSDTPYKAALDTLRYQLASHSFLFIGFSFNDAHFSTQLRQLEQVYEGSAGPHYVLMTEVEARRLGSLAHTTVEPILYKSHGRPLVKLLREMAAAAGTVAAVAAPATALVPIATAPIVRIPPFHYGSVVPLDFFIDREIELEAAKEFITTRQSFLIVGHRRAGKTSFGQKLIHSIRAAGAKEYDLRLMSSIKDVTEIPDESKDLVYLAAVGPTLHFLIFDNDGKKVVNTDEQKLTGQSRQIEALKRRLQDVWPPHQLTKDEKDSILKAATSIVGHSRPKLLGSYLDLQQYSTLDVDRFLSHTLLNLIGEVARQIFCCKFKTLSRKNPYEVHPELQQDVAFKDLLELFHEVVERTHMRGRTSPAELRPDEFERFVADLIEIIHHKGWSNLFIFYDEANRLPLELSVDFLTWNVGALNRAGIVSIYAASPEMAQKFNEWSDREIRIGPFLSVEDMLRLLSRYYFGDVTLKDELPVTRSAIPLIWKLSQGIPYLIQHISGRSFSAASKDGSRHVEERHVRAAHKALMTARPEIFHE